MAYIKIITSLALCALLTVAFGQISQGDPHGSQGPQDNNQDIPHRQAVEDEDSDNEVDPLAIQWTTCDITTTPFISCQDCNTRLICKPIGGILLACGNPYRPYCNNGICSPVPSMDCA